jgi:hypothetical protein
LRSWFNDFAEFLVACHSTSLNFPVTGDFAVVLKAVQETVGAFKFEPASPLIA